MNAKIDYRELFTDKLLNYDTVQLDIYEEGYSNREWYFFYDTAVFMSSIQ